MIIGLGHRKRKGKDTVARILMELTMRSGVSSRRVAFADNVKHAARVMWGWAGLEAPHYYEECPEAREEVLPAIGKTPRELWIETGMWARSVCPNTWVHGALYSEASCQLTIITDVRFPNEVEEIRAMGGVLIKVERPSVPDDPNSADEALADYDGWDHIIENSGTLDDLYAVVKNLWEGYAYAIQ